jgi:hypothetical protein
MKAAVRHRASIIGIQAALVAAIIVHDLLHVLLLITRGLQNKPKAR